MKLIELSGSGKGSFITVDEDDFLRMSNHKWYIRKDGYVQTSIKGKTYFIHRMIMGTPKGLYTDHLNHDKLDNRKSNLRICTHQENMNNKKTNKGSVSQININGSTYFIGSVKHNSVRYQTTTFDTREQAVGGLKQLIKDYELV